MLHGNREEEGHPRQNASVAKYREYYTARIVSNITEQVDTCGTHGYTAGGGDAVGN